MPCDAFVWPANRSYTREPVVELHTSGSPPLLEAVLSAVCRAGARLAEPGEFTLRAFLAGRLDLTQAEAVLGVIDAHGEEELAAALAQLAGGLAGPLHRLRDELLQLLAELEAGLDFVEDDIEFVTSQELMERLDTASRLLDDVAAQLSRRHTAGQFAQIALVGPPNVGKSSLFNALVARHGTTGAGNQPRPAAALVSPQQGTTRDYLTASVSLDGLPCELVDTAGMEEALTAANVSRPRKRARRRSSVEDSAQAMAKERGARAVIRAHCIEALEFTEEARAIDLLSKRESGSNRDVFVLTKCDLAGRPIRLPDGIAAGAKVAITSSQTGEGLEELCAMLRKSLAREETAERRPAIAATADRCRESIRLARTAIESAAELVTARGGDELVAVELRAAVNELGKVVGAVYTDDLLDRIFKTFCIGK